MNKHFAYTILGFTIMTMGIAAKADQALDKQALQVNFNQLIDDSNREKKQIEGEIDSSTNAKEEDAVASDKKKIEHLVDIEVGYGDQNSRPIVDRRYDSIAKPQLVDLQLIPNFVPNLRTH